MESTRDSLHALVGSSGLWVDEKHTFILSPDVFPITRATADGLCAFAEALHDCLGGIGRIAAIASTPNLAAGPAWRKIARTLDTGIPARYKAVQHRRPGAVPGICKVDFMIDVDGNWRIAEIDGHNKHGLGYSTVAARMRDAVMNGQDTFPGVVEALARSVARRGDDRLAIVYADQERFYEPELRILVGALSARGVGVTLFREEEASVVDGRITVRDMPVPSRLYLDLPFMYRNQRLIEALFRTHAAGEIEFIIPPKPFLGSKAALAFLRNDEGNPALEAILRSQIPPRSLELVRSYIPRTFFVGSVKPDARWRRELNGTPYVVKETVAYGMKGTVFRDDEAHDEVLREAARSPDQYVVQEEVLNRPFRFRSYGPDGTVEASDWFTRVTVHVAARAVADIVVTARKDKKVHGAPDCLHLGCVITEDDRRGQ